MTLASVSEAPKQSIMFCLALLDSNIGSSRQNPTGQGVLGLQQQLGADHHVWLESAL